MEKNKQYDYDKLSLSEKPRDNNTKWPMMTWFENLKPFNLSHMYKTTAASNPQPMSSLPNISNFTTAGTKSPYNISIYPDMKAFCNKHHASYGCPLSTILPDVTDDIYNKYVSPKY
jgi:hypothetical protein